MVKAFNTIQAGTLANGARPGSPEEERIAIPVCGDDGAAKQVVSTFIEAVGFAPVDAGTLSASRVQEPHQPLYDKDHTAAQVRAHLAASAPHA